MLAQSSGKQVCLCLCWWGLEGEIRNGEVTFAVWLIPRIAPYQKAGALRPRERHLHFLAPGGLTERDMLSHTELEKGVNTARRRHNKDSEGNPRHTESCWGRREEGCHTSAEMQARGRRETSVTDRA